jgi:hypothetical protein
VTVLINIKKHWWGEVHNAFLAGGAGLIPTTMCFNISTNLWLDAFLAVKGGGDFDHVDSDQNNNNKY